MQFCTSHQSKITKSKQRLKIRRSRQDSSRVKSGLRIHWRDLWRMFNVWSTPHFTKDSKPFYPSNYKLTSIKTTKSVPQCNISTLREACETYTKLNPAYYLESWKENTNRPWKLVNPEHFIVYCPFLFTIIYIQHILVVYYPLARSCPSVIISITHLQGETHCTNLFSIMSNATTKKKKLSF